MAPFCRRPKDLGQRLRRPSPAPRRHVRQRGLEARAEELMLDQVGELGVRKV